MKQIVDAYVLAPGQNNEQEEDAHLINYPCHYSIEKRCQMMASSPFRWQARCRRTAGATIPGPSKAVGTTFLPML